MKTVQVHLINGTTLVQEKCILFNNVEGMFLCDVVECSLNNVITLLRNFAISLGVVSAMQLRIFSVILLIVVN